ncbi:hypothetical protein DENIS_1355 [Desulfonema ishimotonii]|uniref:Uncharacterized protein n=1 Tax=Desulfonema ishimotonii TaxID=45657 RepID=A0A401FTX2_9BACT|nr:hypothetical protein [Desulfonema ishimotonii]GBC60403.1 hypothetical protein DENIS_1355 [Desulfonema ishimotonii]
MPHEYAGHYAAKHPPGTQPDPRIAEALNAKVRDGKISCAAAHSIAEELNVSPAQVGKNMDLLEMRLHKCQMGLFGYTPEKRLVRPAESVSPALEQAIRSAMRDNRIPCVECWAIAEKFGISRMEIANACEALNIKSSPCQIGAF